MNRRNFFKFSALSAAGTVVTANNAQASEVKDKAMASIIDIDLCDGCKDFDIPRCVSACRTKNEQIFPVPKKPIMPYFPQKKFEDYSDQKDNISRLTPYNFTYIETLKIDEKQVFIPRRCMHCDHPPCQKLCPFGVIGKSDEGAVSIDKDFCVGGAKCRDVCPWGVPQRQAGVGIYLKVMPKLAGGGVMYKCDMCADLLAKNQKPVCETACPKNAIKFGKKDEIFAIANEMKKSRFIYGMNENGGTSTIYVSSVDFNTIDEAISKKYKDKSKSGIMDMKFHTNPLRNSQNLAMATLIAPMAALGAASIAVIKSKKDKK
ncbi:4Fe-4S dicluster domain-containing protein [Campylobacter sp. RM9344]|uniref:4Fe-4S dicluster domain-containing protein n=1 Tax=Campylobacter californiensis TaxID=1032243 RepID=A0AAW3ZSN0_9BACT|nr:MULTISPECIES: 4Fe-4S dicluster domain-containing protein [unclassified Campylobacter]MBE2984175.1 4Fe-4S dicluster domain-containing protein [Campylobacter sp. RM6883]MBE2986201.1 4Fe-4S dicluster domain-containing protein [Campylobacter sp. RM12919]MBE2988198.1 4Fe-4S dicluster domain-containing protein [Campylobacter sp. RM12920]MBE2995544.1 4Fe-4S dicluster domain-containing protein [Campylobacter sp. RM6913]MBE3029787.1 4Fe-4S dicluster domain-containing protein [Campylobacter sp. RM934